jgi:hypothetical protein
MTDTTIAMPAFVFDRRRHVELEAGFLLAGQLFVDIPKGKLKGRDERFIHKIIQRLTANARSGLMQPTDALIVGWRGGVKPPNAADITDDKLMGAWAARSIEVVVRVDPRPPHKDGPRPDSDLLAQMGILKHDA